MVFLTAHGLRVLTNQTPLVRDRIVAHLRWLELETETRPSMLASGHTIVGDVPAFVAAHDRDDCQFR